MKTFIILLAIITSLSGCYSSKEIQVEMINAQLIRIDTVYRYTNNYQQQLTWRDERDIEYVSYATLDKNFVVGVRMMMLKTR